MQVKNWVKELKKMLGPDIILLIAGNKIDLEHERTVPLEEAERWVFLKSAVYLFIYKCINSNVLH